MDEYNNDPYEQKLYEVFQSCLAKGESELRQTNWLKLCRKLYLTEQSDELHLFIQQGKPWKKSVSFKEFRAALLTLLDKKQGLIADQDKDLTIDLQKDISLCDVEDVHTERCNSFKSHTEVIQKNIVDLLDENRLKYWQEKINNCLKENADSTTIYFICNCLGIPTLPKQIMQCIFEKIDQNCDGLINFDEFLILFQSRKTSSNQLMLGDNNDSLTSLTNSDSTKPSFDIVKSCTTSFTRNNTCLDTWKDTAISNTTSLLADGEVKTSDICLADLTTTLCDELKNLNDSTDCSMIQSHTALLQHFLILYQEELKNLNLKVENLSTEKEKLRLDTIEANRRANSLAQEIEEQNAREEEVIQNVRKQIEQRHAEIVQDLTNQLSSERELNAVALKTKDDQLQVLQKENHEITRKFVNILQDNQMLETENDNLRSQIEKLKQTKNELLMEVKTLAAEHDEVESAESKHQKEVIQLIDRIKQLQSQAGLLRDKNDELTAELESLRVHNSSTKDTRQLNLLDVYVARNVQADEFEDKESFSVDEETDYDVFLKHSTTISCISNDQENQISVKKVELENLKELIIKQLRNLLTSNNKCNLEKCVLKDEIFMIINRLQSNLNTNTLNDSDLVKSIAFEMKTECEEQTSESLRDFVPKHKNSNLVKRATGNNNNSAASDIDDNFNNQDKKSATQNNKLPSLRDYPPRKEEHIIGENSKSSKETNKHIKILNEVIPKIEDLAEIESIECTINKQVNPQLQETEIVHATEKKQLTERCFVLERSLDLLRTEYEECEDYWAAKLEEERQLFEQEQKISDQKLTELIAKITEYQEHISPVDKMENGRLSPIEERFNLEQQYFDIEEEYKKCKNELYEQISQKDKEIADLREHLKRPMTMDTSVQVTNELSFLQSYVPMNSFNLRPSNETASKLMFNDNIRKLSHDHQLDQTLDKSDLSNDLVSQITKEQSSAKNHMRSHRSIKETTNPFKMGKSGSHRKKCEIDGKSACAMKEHDKRDIEFELLRETLKLQNLKAANCQCMNNDTQSQTCCVNINTLNNLNMKLQSLERKKHIYEDYKRQTLHLEHLLHYVMRQHQLEVTNLQYLLRNTQEKLHIQFQLNADQTERLTRADILVKDLYIENSKLTANVERLEQHCSILTHRTTESA